MDFVDEAGLLEAETIRPFKVIFATVPDLPSAGATALGAWVKAGGTLITVSNTGSHDEYHEPSTVLAKLSGMSSKRNVPRPGGLYHGGCYYLSGSGRWSGLEAVENGTVIASLCPNATLCKFVACGAAGQFTAVGEDGDEDDESRRHLASAGPVMCNPKSAKPEFCPGHIACPKCGKGGVPLSKTWASTHIAATARRRLPSHRHRRHRSQRHHHHHPRHRLLPSHRCRLRNRRHRRRRPHLPLQYHLQLMVCWHRSTMASQPSRPRKQHLGHYIHFAWLPGISYSAGAGAREERQSSHKRMRLRPYSPTSSPNMVT